MANYYPIEFLPENLDINEPNTKNYLRNNLSYSESANNNTDIVDNNYGKKQSYVASSILNDTNINNNERLTNKSDNIKTTNIINKNTTRSTKINIDSRLRNIQPTNVLESKLNNLQNCLFFTTNSNIILIYHPNHQYSLDDNIVLEYATGTDVKIKKGIVFEKNSNFAKILHPNHGMINNNSYDIIISNVVGNTNSGTYLLNIPINMINRKQKVYFTRSDTDIFNPNYYYIQLDINANAEYTYEYSCNIQYLHIRGIPLNEINANYPITSDRLSGYHTIINIINNNFYQIQVTTLADSSTSTYNPSFYSNVPTGDGNNVLIVKTINTIKGYPNNNNYIINLQRNFYHVSQINLLNTVFPITEKIIKATPISKQNNLFYWQNLADGNTIYNIEIPTGNYDINQLQVELKTQIEKTIRPNIETILVNNIYTYNTNKTIISIDSVKNSFTIEFYQQVILKNAIVKSTLLYDDGFTRIIINFINHNLVQGNKIILSNVLSTGNIPDTYLNGTFNIESIIDDNNFIIKLDRYNDIDTSNTSNNNINGGSAIYLSHPIKSRLLFNYPNTIGNILGFTNVGAPDSITSYNYILNNYDLYDIDVQVNSLGIVTQPRIDTRILNVNPNNYILILTDLPFNDQINLFNTSTYLFAKLMLANNVDNYVYDQFIQIGSTFQEPISTLSNITFSFYDANNQLYDFNNIEHSFTIEIIEQLDSFISNNVSNTG